MNFTLPLILVGVPDDDYYWGLIHNRTTVKAAAHVLFPNPDHGFLKPCPESGYESIFSFTRYDCESPLLTIFSRGAQVLASITCFTNSKGTGLSTNALILLRPLIASSTSKIIDLSWVIIRLRESNYEIPLGRR